MLAALANVFTAIVPVAALLAIGAMLRKREIVDTSLQQGLMRLSLRFFFPAFILVHVPHNLALRTGNAAWIAPATGFLTIAVGLAITWIFAPLCGMRDLRAKRTFSYGVSIYNYGYIALPLCLSLLGADAVAVLLLFNAGVELAIWTIGLMAITGRISRDAWKNLMNPIALGSLFALALNKSELADAMPKWLCEIFAMLGSCAIPTGILLVGMALPALLTGFSWRQDLRATIGACVLRNFLIPSAMLIPVFFFPALLPAPLGAVLALQAAMPAGFFPIVVTQHYGGDARLALRVTLATSILGLITLPAWIILLNKFIVAH